MADKLTMYTGDRYASGYLVSGAVPVKGFDVEFVPQGPGGVASIFVDMVQKQSYDIVDLPLSNYIIARDLGRPLTAVPVFPTMFFPQLGPMVNRTKGIHGPLDLVGKRVGVAGFAFNPSVWLRGIFAHHYDLPVDKVAWVEGEPNSMSGVPFHRSRRFTIERSEGLMQRLEEGSIDVLIMADGGIEPNDKVDRLFADPLQEIRRYVEEASIFPTNSVLAIREATLEEHPGLAPALVDAYEEAGRRYAQESGDDDLHMGLRVGDLRSMGLFPHVDGLHANRNAVRMMVHYCYEQGLIKTLFEPEELFV
jgi:4,5-dihydroxyphthalate decarboxylase